MDSATGSASAYSHVALLKWSGLRKDRRRLIRNEVEPDAGDFIRASTLAPRVGHEYGLGNAALVRLKPEQVEPIKVAYPNAAIHPDPTGEQWGNLLIDQATMKARQRTHLCNPESNAKSIVSFGLHGSYGTTAADAARWGEERAGREGAE